MSEKLIEAHEEAADVFVTLIYILGGISIIGLWANWRKKSYSTIISLATMVFSLVVFFYAQQTGTTGGEIMHVEIRENTSAINNSSYPSAEQQAQENEEEDDD